MIIFVSCVLYTRCVSGTYSIFWNLFFSCFETISSYILFYTINISNMDGSICWAIYVWADFTIITTDVCLVFYEMKRKDCVTRSEWRNPTEMKMHLIIGKKSLLNNSWRADVEYGFELCKIKSPNLFPTGLVCIKHINWLMLKSWERLRIQIIIWLINIVVNQYLKCVIFSFPCWILAKSNKNRINPI